MKSSWKLFGLVLAFQCAFLAGVRADEASTKKALMAKYHLIMHAYMDGDDDEIEKQLSPNFTAKKSGNRNLSRAQFVAAHRELLSAISKVNRMTLRMNKVWVDGNSASVILSQVYDFNIKGTDGRTHRMKEKSVCRDIWVQESGEWKNARSEFLNGLTTHFYQATDGDDARIKAQMAENYLLLQEAYKNKDAERIISFESPDYTEVSASGRVASKSEVDESWREDMKVMTNIRDVRVKVKKVTVEPHRVVVLNNQYLDFDMRLSANKLHRVSVALQERDIWVQYDGIWMLKRTEIVHRKFKKEN